MGFMPRQLRGKADREEHVRCVVISAPLSNGSSRQALLPPPRNPDPDHERDRDNDRRKVMLSARLWYTVAIVLCDL
jgi:hypothetical protein